MIEDDSALGRTNPQRTIAIIGAGIDGLVAADRLKAAGHAVIVLEAQNRVGGRILTLREPFAGFMLKQVPCEFRPRTGLYARTSVDDRGDEFVTVRYIALVDCQGSHCVDRQYQVLALVRSTEKPPLVAIQIRLFIELLITSSTPKSKSWTTSIAADLQLTFSAITW
jgi:monoamine oxidase